MILYYSPGACSLADHIALHEAGMKFDLVKVDLKTHKLDDGRSFTEINPKGYVPDVAVRRRRSANRKRRNPQHDRRQVSGADGSRSVRPLPAPGNARVHLDRNSQVIQTVFQSGFDRGRKDESRRPDPEKTRLHFRPVERTVPVRRKSYGRGPVSIRDVDVGDEKRPSFSRQSERR